MGAYVALFKSLLAASRFEDSHWTWPFEVVKPVSRDICQRFFFQRDKMERRNPLIGITYILASLDYLPLNKAIVRRFLERVAPCC